MASELIVQTIQGPSSGANANKVLIPSGHTLDVSGGTLVPSAGQVVQVLQDETVTHISNSTTSYVDTGLSVTITPRNANSQYYVVFDGYFYKPETGGGGFGYNIFKDGVRVTSSPSDNGNDANIYDFYKDEGRFYLRQGKSYYGSAGSASATTFTVKFHGYATGYSINLNKATDQTQSRLVVMEIAQ